MAEIAVQKNQGEMRIWVRRSRAEIQQLLERNPHPVATPGKQSWIRREPQSRAEAEILAAVWLRDFCSYEDSVSFDAAANTLYFDLRKVADAQATRAAFDRRCLAIELAGIDEHGRLFAEPGDYDLDVRRLVQFVQELAKNGHGEGLRLEAQQVLKEAYGRMGDECPPPPSPMGGHG